MVFFFLANGFFTREMQKSQPKKIEVITGLTGNELVSQGTVDKAASAISDLAKKSDKPISDTKKVVYDQASSTFVIEDSSTGQRQELPGVTEVYVLPVYEMNKKTRVWLQVTTVAIGNSEILMAKFVVQLLYQLPCHQILLSRVKMVATLR